MSNANTIYTEWPLNGQKICAIILIIFFCFLAQVSPAKKLHNKDYKFKISLPQTMKMVNDTGQGEIYYDSVTSTVLIISGRESKFHTVDEYINCNRNDLESALKNWISDSTLQIISCNKNKKATILHFRVVESPVKYQDNIIYFIHHRNIDIQFSFLYKTEDTPQREKDIEKIMRTLKLK